MSTRPLRISPAPCVVVQELDGEAVLLNLESERYYGLDDVGTRAWQLLVDHGDIDTIIARMVTEFDIDEATLRTDVSILVEELTAAGLVVAQDEP